jgi:hypothetical protein
VPLRSHETTQIKSIKLSSYSTLSFERFFYFPQPGSFALYPANACRGNSVISKADPIKNLTVLEKETAHKMDTLENVMKSGNKQSILQYIETKNIFDYKMFDPNFILWMLKDKEFYLQVLAILRKRNYYLNEIWAFGYFHSDLQAIKEQIEVLSFDELVYFRELAELQTFEYFPYYSTRVHKFLNENKSTIRNEQFKKSYFCFLFASLFNEPTSARARISFAYYLLLQDRIKEASSILGLLGEADKE